MRHGRRRADRPDRDHRRGRAPRTGQQIDTYCTAHRVVAKRVCAFDWTTTVRFGPRAGFVFEPDFTVGGRDGTDITYRGVSAPSDCIEAKIAASVDASSSAGLNITNSVSASAAGVCPGGV